MEKFQTVDIGGAVIGGPLGTRTGLAVGSIFYDNHSIVSDPFDGEFNQERASILIQQTNDLYKKYGIQMGFDVIAASPEAMEIYLEFIGSRTDLPLFINSGEAEVRIAGLEAADKLGLLSRCTYTSLNEDSDSDELEALGKHRPAAVVVLASNVYDPTPEGTCIMLKDIFQPMLDEINVTTPIVDVGTMDPPSIGLNIRSIEAVRREFGYPVGCAFSNCFPQWPGLKEMGRDWYNLSLGAALTACRAAGADYLHYGIIEKAAVASHVLGTAEVFYGFASKELDNTELPSPHPIQNMFNLSKIE